MGIILNYVETEAIKNHSHLRIIPIVLAPLYIYSECCHTLGGPVRCLYKRIARVD